MTLQLVWDMDGTLLDSTTVVPDAFVGTVRELAGRRVTRQEVVAAYPLGVPEVILEHFVGHRLAAHEAEVYYRHLARATIAPYDGIAPALAELRTLGHAVVVFTGASRRAATMLLAAAGIEVDLLVGGDQIRAPKPAPDGLIAVAHHLGVETARLAYIGDAHIDLLAAKAAGARSVAAAWGHLYCPGEPADTTLAAPGDARRLIKA